MAWELNRPVVSGNSMEPKICIGLPHTGMCPMEWAVAFRALKIPEPFSTIQMTGQPVDKARNLIVKEFLKTRAEWLFFLDSDVILGKLVAGADGKPVVVTDPDALLRMLGRGLPITTGVYYRRSDPPVPGIYQYFPDLQPIPGHKPITNYPLDRLFPVDAVGAGCLLIHRMVFDKVKPPWFLFGDVDANEFSEDFYFNHKAMMSDIATICDPSVQCFHLLLLKVCFDGIHTAHV